MLRIGLTRILSNARTAAAMRYVFKPPANLTAGMTRDRTYNAAILIANVFMIDRISRSFYTTLFFFANGILLGYNPAMLKQEDFDSLETLLGRTALHSPFKVFIESLKIEYPQVGWIRTIDPILEGYEAANFKLVAESGVYVLKIFEADRQRGNIDSLVRVLLEAPKAGVPVPVLVRGKSGCLTLFTDNNQRIPYYLTEFFDGKSFDSHVPTLEEMIEVTSFLAKLHSLSFPVVEAYDSWGNKNLLKEYELHKKDLADEEIFLISPVVNELKSLDLSLFSKSVIHGDMQKKHVLKSKSGAYCILDFGCMSLDAKVIDLSTHLAWFCLSQETWVQQETIMEMVVSEYIKKHSLTVAEIKSLPILIRASYAAYFMKTSMLMRQGDDSEETRQWYFSSKELLSLSKAL